MALTKKKTPTPASVWPKAGSIDRISDGHEQAGPAEVGEPGTGEDGGGFDPAGSEGGHAQMLAAAAGRRMVRAWQPGSPERHPLLRPRRERDLRGPRPTVARIEDQVRARRWDVHGRRTRVATCLGPPARELEERRSIVAAGHRRCPCPILRAGLRARRRDEDRDQLLRGSARGPVRGDRAADAGRRHRLSRPSRVDPARPARPSWSAPPTVPGAGRSCRSR